MQFIQFVLSNIWVWLGFVFILLIIGALIICIIKELKKPSSYEIKRLEVEKEYWKSEAIAYKLGYKSLVKRTEK